MKPFFILCALFSVTLALSENTDHYKDLMKEEKLVGEAEVTSNILEVVERAKPGVTPLMVEQELTPNRAPYVNNYQRQVPGGSQYNRGTESRHRPYNLDILGLRSEDKTNQQLRPTLDSLASYAQAQGKTVTTPEDLLNMCCQFPACYDPLYELCIDTCRKCETVYPVTSWLPCPPLLNIPDCTSPNLSYMGPLPLVCYPDIGPFGNILPLDSITTASMTFNQGNTARGGLNTGQAYREAIRTSNRKMCSESGICHSEAGQSNIWG